MATWGAGISLKGQKGDRGLDVLTGKGAPSFNAAEIQAYIDTQAGQLYVYTAGKWVSQANLVGPMGINGVDGAFFTGVNPPDASVYAGDGQGIYFQRNGQLWTYTKATGWVDTGENYTGPQGSPGTGGTPGQRGSQIFSGSGVPSNDLSTFSNANVTSAVAGDLYIDTAGGPTLYILGS